MVGEQNMSPGIKTTAPKQTKPPQNPTATKNNKETKKLPQKQMRERCGSHKQWQGLSPNAQPLRSGCVLFYSSSEQF